MIEDELDATRSYRYMDYDGENLTLTQQDGGRGPYLTVDYEGQGPVVFSGTDDVLRTALAMIVRGADKELPYVSTVVHGLRAAIEDIEEHRQYKRGQPVKVYTDWDNGWHKGVIVGYHDSGTYAVHPEGTGIYMAYAADNIRELQEEEKN